MKNPLQRNAEFEKLRKKRLDFLEPKIKAPVKRYKDYERLVRELTEKQPLRNLSNIEKRGFNGYHLDHIISVYYGFKNNIEPNIIADIKNLQMIPRQENMDKHNNCYSVISACGHIYDRT